MSGEHLRDGDQLRLQLFDGEPWNGVSPRVLTRSAKALFLRQKPPRHEVFFDPEQLELWPVHRAAQIEELPRISGGASLLLEPFSPRGG